MKYYVLLFTILVSASNSAIGCQEERESLQGLIDSPIHEISGPYSIHYLEKNHMIEIRETNKIIPFGYANKKWLELKSKIRKGDEIYFMELKDGRFYMNGHVLIRDGCVFGFLMGEIS